ncbi:MAG: hypothetical protein ABIH25_00365 [Candidatus Woesearchaeota archaeon]
MANICEKCGKLVNEWTKITHDEDGENKYFCNGDCFSEYIN